MRYHIALSREMDLEALGRDAAAGKRPRHALKMLSDRLDAVVHMPVPGPTKLIDRLRGKLTGRAGLWTLARKIDRQVGPDDLIYCSGEDIAFPVIGISGARRDRPKIALFAHNLNRPRARIVLKWLRAGQRVDLFVAMSRPQLDFLREYLGVPESRLFLIRDQTDLKFFRPGPPSPDKARPIVASVGLEQRDYRTLALATHDLDVDVRISGFSTDAAVQSQAFPETLPANMNQRFYEWPELVHLYRDADVVVVSLFDCQYSAGITTLTEGTACARPLVVTRTIGLANDLEPDAVSIVPTGDPVALRAAIVRLLEDPTSAQAQAERGHRLCLDRHDSDRYVEEMSGRLAAL